MVDSEVIKNQLQSRFIFVKSDWIAECIKFVEATFGKQSNNEQMLEFIYQQFLIADLNEIGVRNLPSSIEQVNSLLLQFLPQLRSIKKY